MMKIILHPSYAGGQKNASLLQIFPDGLGDQAVSTLIPMGVIAKVELFALGSVRSENRRQVQIKNVLVFAPRLDPLRGPVHVIGRRVIHERGDDGPIGLFFQ
jgi:hypothetical protein